MDRQPIINVRKLVINKKVDEIEIDLTSSKIYPISGINKKGELVTWQLKVTPKGKVILV